MARGELSNLLGELVGAHESGTRPLPKNLSRAGEERPKQDAAGSRLEQVAGERGRDIRADESVSLGARERSMSAAAAPMRTETATLAGGCFWCTEAVFSELQGVSRVLPGYSGGTAPRPTYEQVCTGRTGHAEAVQVSFAPGTISYHDLLGIFFTTHDPTTLNRQGNDVGTQYRSAVFYHDDHQRATAGGVVRELETAGVWRRKIVTEIVPFTVFYPAEEYHHNYFRRNPEKGYCQVVIAPKVAKFRKQYVDRLRSP